MSQNSPVVDETPAKQEPLEIPQISKVHGDDPEPVDQEKLAFGTQKEIKDIEREKEDKLQEEMEEKEIERLSKPFFLGKLYVRFPWIIVVLSWLIFGVFIGINAVFSLFEFNEIHYRDYRVWSDYRVERYDMKELAFDALEIGSAGDLQDLRVNQERSWLTNIVFLCEGDCETVFTAANILKIY